MNNHLVIATAADLVAIGVLAYGVYFRRHRRPDLLLAFVALNIGVLVVTSALLQVEAGIGVGFGLFGILSIIRLRSDQVAQQEIAYYFVALALGLLGGLHPGDLWVSPALSAALVFVVFVADHPRFVGNVRRQIITLDTAQIDQTAALFDRMVADDPGGYRCLEIEGRRVANYLSTYFDTTDLALFRQHRQERRRRFKVRTRSYLDTDASVLEVKAKGLRTVTVKERTPWRDERADQLGASGDDFVATVIGTDTYRGTLVPTLETRYRRAAFVEAGTDARVTSDTDLRFAAGDVELSRLDGRVLIETKSATGRSATDRWLRANGARPLSITKYCIGIALLHPEVQANPWRRVLRRHFT